jgi:hypothetical protein
MTPQQHAAFRNSMHSALTSSAATNRAAMGNWLATHPAQAAYYSNWANNIRTNSLVGLNAYGYGSPFYGGNWLGQSLIGMGLGALGGGYGGIGGIGGLGGLGGLGYGGMGGYGAGYGGLGMFGYSPWAGAYPWNYWYSNPGFGAYSSMYGWNSPYYYDYGPGGNVVYSGNQVLVNGQPVGTPADYSQSAAALAAVDPSELTSAKPEDWTPIGTFSVATSKDEVNPPRVIQLAVNKDGVVSGMIHNNKSNKTYTVQGHVDKDTQRVAFSIGNDPNTVLETGMYNLTQNETPVLAHFGPSSTQNYLFVRLPEPSQEQAAAATTAAAPRPMTEGQEALR